MSLVLRDVLVDKDVETVLDHSMLEGLPALSFGILIGRRAELVQNNNQQIIVSHVFPIDRDQTTVDAALLSNIDQSLAGGLDIVGFFNICTNNSATPADLEQYSRSLPTRSTMLLLDKSKDSHQMRVRTLQFWRKPNRQYDIKIFFFL